MHNDHLWAGGGVFRFVKMKGRVIIGTKQGCIQVLA